MRSKSIRRFAAALALGALLTVAAPAAQARPIGRQFGDSPVIERIIKMLDQLRHLFVPSTNVDLPAPPKP